MKNPGKVKPPLLRRKKLHYIGRQMDNKIFDKLDEIHEKLASIDVTLAVNTAQLTEHVKRTNLLEEHVKANDVLLEEALTPIKTARAIYAFAKLVTAIGSAVAAASAILWTLLKFHRP